MLHKKEEILEEAKTYLKQFKQTDKNSLKINFQAQYLRKVSIISLIILGK